MLKKIIKYTLRALLVVLVVLILVPAPALHTGRTGFRSGSTRSAMPRGRSGWICPSNVSGSPFRSGCRWTTRCWSTSADTLLSCGRLSLDVALWPLVRKEVVIRSFGLSGSPPASDSLAGMDSAFLGGPVIPGCGQGADLLANTAGTLQPRPVGCRCPAGYNASGSEREGGTLRPHCRGRLASGKLSVGNLAFGMRTAPGIGTLRPPDRRHGG